jgi:hypothetical protein
VPVGQGAYPEGGTGSLIVEPDCLESTLGGGSSATLGSKGHLHEQAAIGIGKSGLEDKNLVDITNILAISTRLCIGRLAFVEVLCNIAKLEQLEAQGEENYFDEEVSQAVVIGKCSFIVDIVGCERLDLLKGDLVQSCRLRIAQSWLICS